VAVLAEAQQVRRVLRRRPVGNGRNGRQLDFGDAGVPAVPSVPSPVQAPPAGYGAPSEIVEDRALPGYQDDLPGYQEDGRQTWPKKAYKK